MQYSVPFSFSIPVLANAQRTITFKNYCSNPVGGAAGSNVVIVTMINGPTIGMSMYPTNAPSPQAYNNPYLCGAPGSSSDIITTAGTLGKCSWKFNLPSLNNNPNYAFNWVSDGGNSFTGNKVSRTSGIESKIGICTINAC